jgi:PAS domain S-box-containing protein
VLVKPKLESPNPLMAENAELRARLDEAEETLRAIRSGGADALVVPGIAGERIFTLKGADHSYRMLIENMNEGALTVTAEGLILYANRCFGELLRMPLEKVIGSSILAWLAPDSQRSFQSLLRKDANKKCRAQLILTDGDGTQVPIHLSVSHLLTDEISASFCLVVSDLTEQKRLDAVMASEKLARELLAGANEARLTLLSVIEDQKLTQEALQASLREKEILFREIHHRVKNNMQIISSLFNLQAGHVKDKDARRMLKEGQLRIRSMALVHEKLYQSRDLSKIDFADYLRSLSDHLFQFFRIDAGRIRLETDLEHIHVDINSAVPCGLLVTELITNALKHAFPGDRKGVIGISFHRKEDGGGAIELRVADDGVGFPGAVDFLSTETLGLQIVSLLVGQLEGTIKLDRESGTAFTVVFRELGYKVRI